ncbi:MAG: hypothetical protein NVS2B7_09000 [Herpetosiphon sp.]
MILALNLLGIVAYGVALFLLWTDHTYRPLLLLTSGSIAMLGQPLLARLFGTTLPDGGRLIHLGQSYVVPASIVLAGGVLFGSPPLIVLYGLRHGWWGRHYATGWGFYLMFVLFFLIIDVIGLSRSTVIFARPQLGDALLLEGFLQILLLSGISFGILYAVVATRHFALRIALLPLLLSGLVAELLFYGVFGSPFWVLSLLHQQSQITGTALPAWVVAAGALVSIGLTLWGVHLLASGLHEGRAQRLQWR